jgi:HEAT repeat protein
MSIVLITEVSERTQALVRCLKNTGTRHLAANVLAAERPADAVEPLAALLDDRSDQVRATAVTLLGGVEGLNGEIRAQLSRLAQNDRNPVVRSLAVEVLQGIAIREAQAC